MNRLETGRRPLIESSFTTGLYSLPLRCGYGFGAFISGKIVDSALSSRNRGEDYSLVCISESTSFENTCFVMIGGRASFSL